MPRPLVNIAAALMILAAAAGTYLGFSRSLSSTSIQPEEAGAVVPAVTPVSSAHPITGPVMDEAEVRRMAREEAQTLIAKAAPAAPKKAVVKDDDDDADSTSQKVQATVPLVPLAPATIVRPVTSSPN